MEDPDARLSEHDRRLLEELDRGFESVRQRAGAHLLCARGCSDCCHGPFPITRLDVRRLRRGLRAATATTRAAIVAAAQAALVAMQDGFPGEIGSGRLASDEGQLDRFFARHARLRCPVLDETSGACRLWEHRPVACRTYGPPLAFEGVAAPHCGLCFTQARAEEVEASRWTPDPEGLEQAALRALSVDPGDDWDMLIAHAIGLDP